MKRSNPASGVNIQITTPNGMRSGLGVLIAKTMRFLARHRRELRRLRRFHGVEHATLDFGVAQASGGWQCDRFPPDLLRELAGLHAGLEISTYGVDPPRRRTKRLRTRRQGHT